MNWQVDVCWDDQEPAGQGCRVIDVGNEGIAGWKWGS